MIGDFDNNWEEEKELVQRFENSLKSNLDLYFEEEELEDIIRFYFEQQKFKKAYKASKIALIKFPFSIEIKLLMAQSLIFMMNLRKDWIYWKISITFPLTMRKSSLLYPMPY